MIHILFNQKSNNGKGDEDAKKVEQKLGKPATLTSVIGLDLSDFFKKLKADDEVILTGGDGTLNVFVNEIKNKKIAIKNSLKYAKCGSGNDFFRDVESKADENGLIDLAPYIEHLPVVTVNDKKAYFLNNIGFGVDGMCTEIGDKMRVEKPGEKIDYSKIAIKLLLGGFEKRDATVEVDGKTYEHKNVWVAPTMNGRFYGGGMMSAPDQDRLNKEHSVSLVVFTGKGRLTTLLRFPKFSAGKAKNKKYLTTYVGKHIKVTFTKPCALQIDGETVLNVTTYTVDAE